ncbi:MAG TPA: hypothetical protein VMU24_10070 [Candidatus Acidoferrales bacterium]|nr:hypothetical protein [Candidatus Acidoferrales bacterium]
MENNRENEDNRENENGFVSCARCGDTCDLAAIPQVATDCSTMEGEQAANTLDVAPEELTKKPAELCCDWSVEPEAKKAA